MPFGGDDFLVALVAGVVVCAGEKVFDYKREVAKESDAWLATFNLVKHCSERRPDICKNMGWWSKTQTSDYDIYFLFQDESSDYLTVYFNKRPFYEADIIWLGGGHRNTKGTWDIPELRQTKSDSVRDYFVKHADAVAANLKKGRKVA